MTPAGTDRVALHDPAVAEEAFAALYGGRPPTHLVRAPGRVNLIGEHIDYNGLPVLPMAVQRGIRLLIRPREDRTVRIATTLPGRGPRRFTLDREIPPSHPGDWGNYAKAAARVLVLAAGPLRGFDGLVDSDLPVAAGLSSSSALVVACALALLEANGLEMDRLRLAALLAAGERYAGLRGGGMDQAICLCGSEGHAARIDFDPLRVTPVPVPAAWAFPVAHSLSRAEKAGPAGEVYNRRTEECREALAALLVAMGGDPATDGYPDLRAAASTERLLAIAAGVLDDPLRRRVRHVLTEADRVEAARQALLDGDAETFGRLLCDSHRSLREDYEVSTHELDELVEIALEAGAWGARLTGAGLGGCILAVCPGDRVGALLAELARRFYRPRGRVGDLSDVLFVARPSAGAAVGPAAPAPRSRGGKG